ncbi:reverse transcriptase domain-containing protein, partial [Tanacetum coccineum]
MHKRNIIGFTKDVPCEAIKLMIFPFSLAGAARAWLDKEPPNSITTWADLVTREALTIIENKSKVYNSINKPIVPSANNSSPSDIAALAEVLKALVLSKNEPQPPPAPTKAMNQSCVTCGGPHPYYECTASNGYTRETVYAAGNNQTEDRNLLSYRSNNYLGPPSFNVPNQNVQAQLATQANILQTIMSKLVQQEEKPSISRSLPSNTVPNPHEQVNAITTRSGKAYEGPLTNPPVPAIARESRFIKLFKQLRLEIGLKDALIEMPKFKKWLSALLRNKEKLEKIAITPVNAECSAIILNKVPEKLGDPGKFLIPCALQDLDRCNALADSGASINLLPHS